MKDGILHSHQGQDKREKFKKAFLFCPIILYRKQGSKKKADKTPPFFLALFPLLPVPYESEQKRKEEGNEKFICHAQ